MGGLPQGKRSMLPLLMGALALLPQVDRSSVVLAELLEPLKAKGLRL